MKFFIWFIALFIIHTSLYSQSKKQIKTVKDSLNFMKYIRAGYSKYQDTYPIIPTPADSHLLAEIQYLDWKKQTINSFYISDHEVTNGEYKLFINWVKDSLRKSGITGENVFYHFYDKTGRSNEINILPDSVNWMREFRYHMGDPMMEYYHNKKEFDQYPMVNVSYYQALAYLHWYNRRFDEFMKSNGFKNSWGAFRLPEQYEWELATDPLTSDSLEDLSVPRIYPWKGVDLRDNKNYFANFGIIRDINGVQTKSIYEDGYMYTAPIKSYSKSDMGLYDMAGNVSEWTNRKIEIDSVIAGYHRYYQKLLHSKYSHLLPELLKENPDWTLFEKYIEKKDNKYFNPQNDMLYPDMRDILYIVKDVKRNENHNMNVLRKISNPYVVKGGSWYDGPAYMLNATLQVYTASLSSCKVGFRVVLDLSPEAEKLLKSKGK